ncbi:uncharacterized protein LOC121244200 [Juglans microcarpa x Juglans regia]|uniref:uncharacterized protein LOC121244200 n=1 Tax=Juglans microcarpa x Juglans regia TaxID=2249226 RepID=UPI001B7F51FF|nr:uncharacterized protein LOC121244200 [Juglans microcarpa x Juglans regia]
MTDGSSGGPTLKGYTKYNADECRRKYSAHILNLIVTEGLKDVDDSVARVRLAMKFVRSSPSRLEKFKIAAKRFAHDQAWTNLIGEMTRDTLYKFYDEFKAIKGGTASTTLTATTTPPLYTEATKKRRLAWTKTLAHNLTLVHQSTKVVSELDNYLSGDLIQDDDDFDILGWWKATSKKYPILSEIARCILAIPISTVASESAFSTGGRILDLFRSSLSHTTVEALIYIQSWTMGKDIYVPDVLDFKETDEEGGDQSRSGPSETHETTQTMSTSTAI